MTGNTKNNITFMLDGQRITPPPMPPDTTLLNYLRDHLGRKGTKEGCAEGDCGACTIVVADLQHGELRYRAMNACIQFLPTLDGKVLYTVESLQSGHTLHPVQQAMSDCHASQCGFCTPGFVMSLFALYKTQFAPDREQISAALSGNLCRCTGYRPILDAGQRMYEYADRLDSAQLDVMRSPCGITQGQPELIQQLRDLNGNSTNPNNPDHLHSPQTLALDNQGQRFFAPTTTTELAALVEQYPDATILAGGTDVGLWVTKQYRELPTLIYLGKVAELDYVRTQGEHIEIGAAATLEDAYRLLTQHYPALNDLHTRFASPPIRNAGTLVGNVANGSPIGDSMPALIALKASVILRKGEQQREVLMDDFYLGYQKKDLATGEFVEAVHVPLPQPKYIFRTWKIAKRFEQDISAVCAAFQLSLNADNTVGEIRICLGGMAAIPKRAEKTEHSLLGQVWDTAHVEQAMLMMEQDFTPLSDMRASATYRMRVAKNLLKKFYLETGKENPSPALPLSREEA